MDSDFEPNIYIYYYGMGIGLTRYARLYEPSPNFSVDKKLFYYRKGDESCGTPDLTTSIVELVKENQIEWTITRSTPRGEFTMSFSGTVEGDTMSGEVEMGNFGRNEWSATRK